jgi:DMSO reductase anchor subunit
MRPALSIVFFTVSSGAGLGLIALLVLADLLQLGGGLAVAQILTGGGLGLAMVAAGLVSSTMHLATPKNAWRAFSRFSTSWLSREAVFAAAFFPACALYLAAVAGGWGAVRLPAAILTLLLAWAVLHSTAMIYASLKPIRQWHTPLTPLAYMLLGHASGALLLLWIATRGQTRAMPYMVLALVLLAGGVAAKLAYYARARAGGGPGIGEALGVKSAAQVKLLDAGHSHGTFLTSEFVFHMARAHAARLRACVWAFGFAVPAVLVATLPDAALLAALACLAGLLAERWLFFAEAQHTVTLYHGAPRA